MLPLGPPAASWPRGTAIGLAALAVLTAIKLAFTDAIGTPTPFLTYFGAVMIAAWYGGMTAGLVTTLAAGALGYVGFIAGRTDMVVERVVAQLAVFGIEGVTIGWLVSRLASERSAAATAASTAADAANKLESALDAIDEGITLLDPGGKLVFANRRAAEICGMSSPRELLAATPDRIIARMEMHDEHGAPLPAERLPSRAALAGRKADPITMQFRIHGEQAVHWTEVSAASTHDDTGALRFVVNVFRDITARRASEEALRVSQAWFSTALRSIGDAVVATDDEGRITFVNPVAEALTGWPADEARGRPLAEVFRILGEHDRRPVESPVDRVLREGVVVGLANHTLLVRKDGSEVAIDDSAAPIRDGAGDLVGVVLVFRDVSSARREEQRREFLAKATSELNSSLDFETTLATVARLAVPDVADWCAVDIRENEAVRRLAVAHVDPAKIEWVHEIERKYPPDRNAPTGVPEILRTGKPELLPQIPAALLEAAARDEEHLRIIRELQLRSYIGVPLARGGEVFGVITLVMAESKRSYDERDLAFAIALADRAAVAIENARLFREVERARGVAELASRAKDEFLAMLGHELRNPLAPMLTALELSKLRNANDGDPSRAIIERQLRHMVRLVDDLLDVSRITRGKVELARAPVELAEVVSRGLEMAAPLVEERKHQVVLDVPAGLVVDVDPARIAQVVANLLNNAAKYTPAGGTISVHAAREGGAVVLRVRDTGMGIAPEMLAQVFEAFVQEPQAIDRARGGLGLGLTIARSLVQAHGGTISAKSDGPGKGSELVVVLPAGETSAAVQPVPEPASAGASAGGVRVLVVDDNEDALELVLEALRMLGYEPTGAADGEQALAIAGEARPVIALLDLGLPVIDGYELARRLRALPGLEGMRLVAVTGYGQRSDRERTAAAGFAAHLVKPVSIEDIRRTIEQLVG